MKTRMLVTLLSLASLTTFAAPGGGGAGQGRGDREERLERRQHRAHLTTLVAISEALELSDAEALKLGDKLKAVEDKRWPLRQQMGEAMKSLRDASEGDAAALGQVDANVQRVLDGRAQLAALDKDMFTQLSQGLTPQKKAKLALVLARLGHEGKGKKGRHHGRN